MDFLVFQLQAPLSSWGEAAVGEYRGTATLPSQSALIGLLGAALGLLREDEAAHAGLRDGLCFAVGQLSGGSLLRDYHTTQVPPRTALKGRPQHTRRQEMAVPKPELSTILSTRDYRQNAACLVAVQTRGNGQDLQALASALREPRFTLYLGRKSCAIAAPLWPQVLSAADAKSAMTTYGERFEAARAAAALDKGKQPPLEPLPTLQCMVFDEHISAGVPADLSTLRKDRLIRRQAWQFGDRQEHVALFSSEV